MNVTQNPSFCNSIFYFTGCPKTFNSSSCQYQPHHQVLNERTMISCGFEVKRLIIQTNTPSLRTFDMEGNGTFCLATFFSTNTSASTVDCPIDQLYPKCQEKVGSHTKTFLIYMALRVMMQGKLFIITRFVGALRAPPS